MKTSLHQEEVQHILKHGERYACAGLVVCVFRFSGGFGRYAVLIPKKVLQSSVARNRMRRVLREVIRKPDQLCGNFVVLHNNKNSSEAEVKEHLGLLLSKASSVMC